MEGHGGGVSVTDVVPLTDPASETEAAQRAPQNLDKRERNEPFASDENTTHWLPLPNPFSRLAAAGRLPMA